MCSVYFDKPVSATALKASNYKISGGLNILSITSVNQSTVQLGTGTMPPGTVYQLTISGVQDMAATPNTIVTVTVPFESFAYAPGAVLHKKYNNCNDGYSLADFFADPRYPANPDRQDVETFWEYPPNGAYRVAADPARNYIDTLEGFFIPPTTANYVFYICGDDEYYLYLSTDDTAANIYEVAAEPGGWSDVRNWNFAYGGTVSNWNTATYSSTEWPDGNTVTLNAGQRYYMLAIHHDHSWSGGDWFGATYSGPGVPPPNNLDTSTLTGGVVGYLLDPDGESISLVQQPTNTTIAEETSASFSALATGVSGYGNIGTTVAYQWQLAPKGSTTWTNVTGATAPSYTTAIMGAADNGDQIRVIASVLPLAVTSSIATLTVTVDTTPVTVTNVNAYITLANVKVYFDKPVSDTALTASNYKISGGVSVLPSVTRVDANTVLLATSAMVQGAAYTLTVSGVQDMDAVPHTIAANTQVQFQTYLFSPGEIVHKKYNNCSDGFTLADFFADPRYPNNPDRVDAETMWEYPPGNNDRVAADPVRNYIDTLEGYFIPPTTGDYVFYICGDDEFYLYLSTDDTVAHMEQIAAEPGGWSDNRAWSINDTSPGYHSGTATNWVSATYSGTAWPQGNTINLTAGQKYYMLAVHHNHSWSGGDWFGANLQRGRGPCSKRWRRVAADRQRNRLPARSGRGQRLVQPAAAECHHCGRHLRQLLGDGDRHFGLRKHRHNPLLPMAVGAKRQHNLDQHHGRNRVVPRNVDLGYGGQRGPVPGNRQRGAHLGDQFRRHPHRAGRHQSARGERGRDDRPDRREGGRRRRV